MKKLYIFLLLIVASLSLTACTKKEESQDNQITGNGEQVTVTGDEEEVINTNLLDLAKLGKNIKCTFEYDDEEMKTSGESYVSGENTRSNITMITSEGKEVRSSTITDENIVYTWTSESNQGTKMDLSTFEDYEAEEVTDDAEDYQYNNKNQEYTFKCRPWTPDNSVFEVPTNINFVDYAEMMKSLLEMSEQLGQ